MIFFAEGMRLQESEEIANVRSPASIYRGAIYAHFGTNGLVNLLRADFDRLEQIVTAGTNGTFV